MAGEIARIVKGAARRPKNPDWAPLTVTWRTMVKRAEDGLPRMPALLKLTGTNSWRSPAGPPPAIGEDVTSSCC